MELHITTRAGQKLRWPEECACCRVPANKTVRTYPLDSGQFGLAVRVPYCARCQRHVLAETRGALAGWWIGLMPGFAMLAAMWISGDPPEWMELAVMPVLVIPFFGGIIWGKKIGRQRAAKSISPQCASASPAVLYLQRQAVRDGVCHQFLFRNDAYFRSFLDANRHLLERAE